MNINCSLVLKLIKDAVIQSLVNNRKCIRSKVPYANVQHFHMAVAVS